MRKNQIILDEAARSVRRAFVSSVAGSATMLGVIGVAGAYGMPERLSAQSLSSALTTLQIKLTPMVDAAQPAVARAEAVADSFKQRVQSVAIESDDEVILQVPRVMLASAGPVRIVEPSRVQELSAPVSGPVAPPMDVIAMPDAPVTVTVEKPAAIPVEKSEPAPTVTASLPAPVAPEPEMSAPKRSAGAMPDVVSEPPSIPAPLVFEQPELDKIKPLTALPKLEIVESPAKPAPQKSEQPKVVASLTPEASKAEQPAAENPAMSAMATATTETPVTDEFPKPVMVYLPLPRPPKSPAQLLDLHDADYDKAEKCLAQAVYFEARDEPVRGQQAVAQVVLNRVFSPYYPKDVCSVVYQNANHHLACQFTFACDGKPEAIRERGAWARANRIAKQALSATVWLPEVAKATHYHATYVHPNWISDMKMLVKTGMHIFYRPRNWGDGSKEPSWGTPSAAAAAAPMPAPHKKGVRS